MNDDVAGCCCLAPLALPVHYMCTVPNIIDYIDATHIAVMDQEVIRIRTKRKQGCRFSWDETGETRDTVPVDQIQDIAVVQPAGGGFCCAPKEILAVRVIPDNISNNL
jgi:hypothetical protein